MGGRYVPAVVQLIFIRTNPVEFSGVDLDIRAHFAKGEGFLLISLRLSPGNVIIPCTIDKSTDKVESWH